jgi:hypothetical protein
MHIPDQYEIRRTVCNILGHKYDQHRNIVDYTLEEVHYLHCERCYFIIKETENCLATTENQVEDLNWSEVKHLIHNNDKYVPV